jgi:hypothetical protein
MRHEELDKTDDVMVTVVGRLTDFGFVDQVVVDFTGLSVCQTTAKKNNTPEGLEVQYSIVQ